MKNELIEDGRGEAGDGPGDDRAFARPEEGRDNADEESHEAGFPRRSYAPVDVISTGRRPLRPSAPSTKMTPSTSGAWRADRPTRTRGSSFDGPSIRTSIVRPFQARSLAAFRAQYPKGRNFVVSPLSGAAYDRVVGGLKVSFVPPTDLRQHAAPR